MKKTLITLIALAVLHTASAQTNELSGWAAWFHTQKFNDKWGASCDGQFRTAHQASFLKNILLRPSVNYYFDKSKHLDLGYAYVTANGRASGVPTFRPEHRIFEQFIIAHKVGHNIGLSHRFRLEQRFLGKTATQTNVFAQRLRYFVRGVIPLNKDAVFANGTFVALQNEAFANIQNKDKINKHLFDQNRAYTAFGYRFSKMVDLEAGYMNQYIKQAETYTINHVVQVALYTRFGF